MREVTGSSPVVPTTTSRQSGVSSEPPVGASHPLSACRSSSQKILLRNLFGSPQSNLKGAGCFSSKNLASKSFWEPYLQKNPLLGGGLRRVGHSKTWGYGSVGRALRSQRRGHEFESRYLHQANTLPNCQTAGLGSVFLHICMENPYLVRGLFSLSDKAVTLYFQECSSKISLKSVSPLPKIGEFGETGERVRPLNHQGHPSERIAPKFGLPLTRLSLTRLSPPKNRKNRRRQLGVSSRICLPDFPKFPVFPKF